MHSYWHLVSTFCFFMCLFFYTCRQQQQNMNSIVCVNCVGSFVRNLEPLMPSLLHLCADLIDCSSSVVRPRNYSPFDKQPRTAYCYASYLYICRKTDSLLVFHMVCPCVPLAKIYCTFSNPEHTTRADSHSMLRMRYIYESDANTNNHKTYSGSLVCIDLPLLLPVSVFAFLLTVPMRMMMMMLSLL